MPDGKTATDYRLYLDAEFSALREMINNNKTLMNAQFETVHSRLDGVLVQTTKTNNRVNHLEEDVEELEKELRTSVAWGKHIVDTRATECPNLPNMRQLEKKIDDLQKEKRTDVQEIKDNLMEYNFFKRYPKTMLAIGVFALAVLAVSLFSIWISYSDVRESQDIKSKIDLLEKHISDGKLQQ